MSQILIDKIKKEREVVLEIDGIKMTARRPTHLEMAEMEGNEVSIRDLLRRFVIGWEMTEIQLFPGGTPKAVPFSTDLFMTWVEDKPSFWTPTINAITQSYKAHKDRIEAELVKPDAG